MARFYYDVILGLVLWSFKEPIEFNYAIDKNKRVTFQNGKPSMKLRQYINLKARIIGRLSIAQAPILRTIFIEAYNLEGIKGIDKLYSHTSKKLIKSLRNG